MIFVVVIFVAHCYVFLAPLKIATIKNRACSDNYMDDVHSTSILFKRTYLVNM